MPLPINEIELIYTGLRFFGLRIYVKSTGDAEVDAAIKTVFKDDYMKTAPLRMERRDVSLVLGWYYEKQDSKTSVPVKEQNIGQSGLFEGITDGK